MPPAGLCAKDIHGNTSKIPSHLSWESLDPWETYLVQIDRVEPYLDAPLLPGRNPDPPKRSLIVDVPIRLD